MKLDLLILQLAVIFLPGLIWARLDARYALKAKPSDLEFMIRAFLFGVASYAVTFLVYALAGWPIHVIDLAEANSKLVISQRDIALEIALTTGTGILLAVLWICSATYRWLTRLLLWLKVTKKYGDEDVWDFTLNSGRAGVDYVHMRDFENKMVYAGWVESFSETDKLRELVLRDAQVFDFDSAMLYEVPLIYLARLPEKMHIEFPYQAGKE
jgi:hypothetical protein